LNLSHLYFDIVSTVRCPVEDFDIRISDLCFREYQLASWVLSLLPLCLRAFVAMSKICKTNPISWMFKMNVTYFLTKNYEQLTMNNEPIKTNPIKPNL